MTIQIETYIRSLASDYLTYISLMASGDYDGDELRELSAQRGVTHDQLIAALGPGHERDVFDMKAYCRDLVNS